MENNIDIVYELVEWIKSLAFGLVVALFITTFLFIPTRVKGTSMEPTLKEKDRMISLRAPLFFQNPSRGDVIVLKIPNPENRSYIKRVIGIEGDKVEILNGQVYLNDELLVEDYIEEGIYTFTESENSWLVPKDELFVLGDNRNPNASYDSRGFGTIPLKAVKGIANFRFFPLGARFGNVNKTP